MIIVISLLLIVAAEHGVFSDSRKLCVFQGTLVKLFSISELDVHKESWALYVNGARTYTHIATWRIISSSTVEIVNDNSKISIDQNRDIWFNDVGKTDKGTYSIKYTQDDTNGPKVVLEVFELTQEKELQYCQGYDPKVKANYSANTATSTTTTITDGSIARIGLSEKDPNLMSTADKTSSETSPMMTAIILVLAIMGLIVIALLIAGFVIFQWCKKRSDQQQDQLDHLRQDVSKLGERMKNITQKEEIPLSSVHVDTNSTEGQANHTSAETETDTSNDSEPHVEHLAPLMQRAQLLTKYLGKMLKKIKALKTDHKQESFQNNCNELEHFIIPNVEDACALDVEPEMVSSTDEGTVPAETNPVQDELESYNDQTVDDDSKQGQLPDQISSEEDIESEETNSIQVPLMDHSMDDGPTLGKLPGDIKYHIDDVSKPDKLPVAEATENTSLCRVCLKNTKCMVFLPCGHLVTCPGCANAVSDCPQCRVLIRSTVKGYSKRPDP